MNLTRRMFFPVTAGAALAPHWARAAVNSFAPDGKRVHEPERDVPVKSDVDVLVCGGGPAGCAAALAAARNGASVQLLESKGCLGGTWTAGLLSWVFDFSKQGIVDEIKRALEQRGARGPGSHEFTYEPEEMKVLLEELCLKAGVKIRLMTQVVAVIKEGRRLCGVVTESKSGREAWRGKIVIDTTGDGDVGALAGCGFDEGQPGTGLCQPLTLNALVLVKDAALFKDRITGADGTLKTHIHATSLNYSEIVRAGLTPSYGHPTFFPVYGNVLLMMFNHEFRTCAHDADQMTAATLHARAELYRISRGLARLGGIWEGFRMISSAEQIGIRESRRIHGLYTVTADDLAKGAVQPDAVTKVTFGIDIHSLAHSTDKENKVEPFDKTRYQHTMRPYDIPLRALIAKDVDGLMMAGRCISGDFIAHASYRVTGDAAAMGEAAGRHAAKAALASRLPQELASGC